MLRFRLFDIPTSVRPSFLLVAALLGFNLGDLRFIAAWVGIVFVSILIHELGHALTARRLGAEVTIELNGVGGLTRWAVPAGELSPGRRALVAASGSFVGVVFGGLVWLIAPQFGPYEALPRFVVSNLIVVNLFWGLLNWLPIRPLDGGHLLMSLLDKLSPDRAPFIARIVFMVTSAAALALSFSLRLPIIGFLAGWLLLAEISAGRPRRPAQPIPTLSYDDPPDGREAEPDVDR